MLATPRPSLHQDSSVITQWSVFNVFFQSDDIKTNLIWVQKWVFLFALQRWHLFFLVLNFCHYVHIQAFAITYIFEQRKCIKHFYRFFFIKWVIWSFFIVTLQRLLTQITKIELQTEHGPPSLSFDASGSRQCAPLQVGEEVFPVLSYFVKCCFCSFVL